MIREKNEGEFVVSYVSDKARVQHILLVASTNGKFTKTGEEPPVFYEDIQDFVDKNPSLFSSPLPSIPGWHGSINKEDAKIKLKGTDPGTYLIREREDKKIALVVSRTKDKSSYYLLTPEGEHYTIKNEKGTVDHYPSLEQFLAKNSQEFSHPLTTLHKVVSNPPLNSNVATTTSSVKVAQSKSLEILSSEEKIEKFKGIINNYHYQSRKLWIDNVTELGLDVLDPKTLLEVIAKIDPKNGDELKTPALMAIISRIGHEWGMEATVKIGNQLIATTESYTIYSHAHVASSVDSYFETRPPIVASKLPEKIQQSMLENLKNSINYSYGSLAKAQSALIDYQAGKAITLGTGWHKHSVEVTVQGDYLVYTNRGEKDQLPNKMTIYKIKDPSKVDQGFFERIMLNNRKTRLDLRSSQIQFFEKNMVGILGLEEINTVPKADQKVGNCSFANAKGGFHALLILHFLNQEGFVPLLMTPNNQQKWDNALNSAIQIFKDWEFYNRQKGLDFFLDAESQKILIDPKSPLSSKEHFKLLCEMSSQLARTQKYEKYHIPPFENTQIDQRIQNMKEKVSNFMKFSEIKLTSCFVPIDTLDNAENYLMLYSSGAFIIHPSPKPDFFFISIRNPYGVEHHEINRKDIAHHKNLKKLTLSDLYHYFENRQEKDKIKYPVMSTRIFNTIQPPKIQKSTKDKIKEKLKSFISFS